MFALFSVLFYEYREVQRDLHESLFFLKMITKIMVHILSQFKACSLGAISCIHSVV